MAKYPSLLINSPFFKRSKFAQAYYRLTLINLNKQLKHKDFLRNIFI